MARFEFAFGVGLNREHSPQDPAFLIGEVAAKGCNTIFFENLDEALLATYVSLARGTGVRLIPQFGGYPLYFVSSISLASAQAEYSRVMAGYQGDPTILAWSVVEEVRANSGYLGRISEREY